MLAGLLLVGCRGDQSRGSLEPEAIVADFATPESVLYDAVADAYLVSNINGSPLAVDDNGFVSRVDPDSGTVTLKWIEGGRDGVTLNAPKGMAVVADTLYVADLTAVRLFDRVRGTPIGEIRIEGSSFLNDVAVGPDGSVYVTDSGLQAGDDGFVPSGTDAVYVLKNRAAVPVATGETLARPNGLVTVDGALLVVTFGANRVLRVGDGGTVPVGETPEGGLDGILVTDDGRVVLSSWDAAALFVGPPGGPYEVLADSLEAPADIGYDPVRQRILVPLFQANRIALVSLR